MSDADRAEIARLSERTVHLERMLQEHRILLIGDGLGPERGLIVKTDRIERMARQALWLLQIIIGALLTLGVGAAWKFWA